MTAGDRRRAFIFLAAAATLTLVIGAALPRLAFGPGLPAPRFAGGQISLGDAPEQPPIAASTGLFFRVLAILALGIFVVYLAYAVARTGLLREALKGSLPVLLLVGAVIGILSLFTQRLPDRQVDVTLPDMPASSEPKELVPIPLGAPPPWLLWLVGAVLIGGAIALVLLAWRERQKTPRRKTWQAEAESARQAILAGDDLGDVIVRCYLRMSAALRAQQGIEREPAMTTGEFERLLVSQGIPPVPVHDLTRLYEAVRYGRWQPGAGDEVRALRSLDAILEYGRAPGALA